MYSYICLSVFPNKMFMPERNTLWIVMWKLAFCTNINFKQLRMLWIILLYHIHERTCSLVIFLGLLISVYFHLHTVQIQYIYQQRYTFLSCVNAIQSCAYLIKFCLIKFFQSELQVLYLHFALIHADNYVV